MKVFNMIGMVIITHGNLAFGIIDSLELVMGQQEQIDTVVFLPDDDIEQKRVELMAKIASVDSGKGVIIFTDMFGGTPSNIAITLLDPGKVEVMAGTNMPMLVKMVTDRAKLEMPEMLQALIETGKKYITTASSF